MKNWSKGAWPWSHNLLFKFCDPVISRERLKIQTSNFVCRLTIKDTKRFRDKELIIKRYINSPSLLYFYFKSKKWKIVKRGRGPGHLTYFSNFGTPLISRKWLKIQTSNFARGLIVRDTKPKKKLKIVKKEAWPRSLDLLFKFWDPLISLKRLKV